ncbi:hypothetical protein Dda_1277 [Drechslerella dactyloides]|uniref:Uncharacterized protein n=1 Tax=Drechslerella dactyloides TaxID=74499 RepID=A0AAD6NKG2_DREDA|nr:hypothetical protein Dda_1277 [Drechslerella dactyloides]
MFGNTNAIHAAPAADDGDVPTTDASASAPFSVEVLERQAIERLPHVPHLIAPNPAPLTPEQRRSQKIRGLKFLLEQFDTREPGPDALPAAYKQSMEMGLKAREEGTVSWTDGEAYLWGPTGLVGQGSIQEVQHMHYSFCKQGIRDYHFDPCRDYHLRGQSSQMISTPPYN